MQVDVVTDYDGFRGLKDEWAELLRASRSDGVFLSHEWLSSWWQAFGGGSRMHVPCVRDGGRLVAAAPMCIRHARFRGMPVRRLGFMVNGVSADADFVVADGERDARERLFAHLAADSGEWDMLDLARLRTDSLTWRALPDLARGAGVAMATRTDKRIPYVPVEGNWEAFLKSRSQGFRKTVRKRANRIARRARSAEVRTITGEAGAAEALGCMLEVSARSWKAPEGRSLDARPDQIRFYEGLWRALARQRCARLHTLYLDGRAAAYEFHLVYGQVANPLRADFDEALSDLSPGAYLECELIRGLFEDPAREVREYNSCGDGYAYEMRWTDDVREHGRAWLFRRGAYGRLLSVLARLRRGQRERKPVSVRALE
jgi:CelD/BcsL family acetyltransferase involved in cellulose biosynthesis